MSEKIKIAQIAPIWNDVPPVRYGGIERVVSELTEGLVRLGHDVSLFATKGSKTSAKLISVVSSPMSGLIPWSNPSYTIFNIVNAYKLAGNFDIIHNHADFWGFPFAALTTTPTVHTLHNRLLLNKESVGHQFYLRYPDQKLISISNNQRQGLPYNFVETVYNGIDLSSFIFSPEGGNYLYWTGRINYLKGAKDAVLVARKLRLPLVFAGAHKEGNIEFYNNELKELINNPLITEDNNINTAKESNYYQNAHCTLVPIHWEEPFGLVMVESMACGTPVVSYARGSVLEIVKDGETGFIVNASDEDIRGDWIVKKTGIEGLYEAVKKIYSMPLQDYKKMRLACRKHVEKSFTAEKMVQDYEKTYKKILSKQD